MPTILIAPSDSWTAHYVVAGAVACSALLELDQERFVIILEQRIVEVIVDRNNLLLLVNEFCRQSPSIKTPGSFTDRRKWHFGTARAN